MKLVHAQPQFAVETGVGQLLQDILQVSSALKPDAVGHDLVEAEAKLSGPPADCQHELRINKRLAAGQTQDANAVVMSLFHKPQGHGDIESVGPFNRHAAMRTGQVALIGSGER
jgi:hypothetical protein